MNPVSYGGNDYYSVIGMKVTSETDEYNLALIVSQNIYEDSASLDRKILTVVNDDNIIRIDDGFCNYVLVDSGCPSGGEITIKHARNLYPMDM